jgi:hypothetical protein
MVPEFSSMQSGRMHPPHSEDSIQICSAMLWLTGPFTGKQAPMVTDAASASVFDSQI